MGSVNGKEVFSLQEIQKKLDTEQHRLIHLCEKGVILPDFEDAAGRGTMRRFSERNLFEFAVALELRRFLLPVNYIAPIIRILEAFEVYAAKEIDVFSLPASLQEKPAVRLRLIIAEGERLFFALKQGRTEIYIGSVELSLFSSNKKKQPLPSIKKLSDDPRETFVSYIDIDLNKIAKSIL